MKTIRWIRGIGAALAVVVLAGCGKSESGKVDTARLEKSFASADAAMKSTAQKAVDAIKAGKYQEGLAELQNLAGELKLTPDQQQAVKDVIEQIKRVASDTLNKATQQVDQAGKDASKALGDLQKSLSK